MREYKKAKCAFCKQEKFIAAKGLCRACYQRDKKYGSPEIRPGKARSKCLVEGCLRTVISHGYCELHWDRVKATGDPLKTKRPPDWGMREKHPLWHSWQWAMRSGVVPEWEDFWVFVRDVGQRPNEEFRIKRADENLPFGPENCSWQKHYLKFENPNQYARDHRKMFPDYWKDVQLRKNYGITLFDYNQMHANQNGLCAICKKAEVVVDRRTGKLRMLAVDHCHAKGHLRKLLCHSCNNGLGAFKDNPALLRAAAEYLEQH